ncbi:hypothetical protein D3C86_2237180 [compost metagenome]
MAVLDAFAAPNSLLFHAFAKVAQFLCAALGVFFIEAGIHFARANAVNCPELDLGLSQDLAKRADLFTE